jgi:hypothetical protein
VYPVLIFALRPVVSMVKNYHWLIKENAGIDDFINTASAEYQRLERRLITPEFNIVSNVSLYVRQTQSVVGIY